MTKQVFFTRALCTAIVCLMLVSIAQTCRMQTLKSALLAENAEVTRLGKSNALVGLHLATLDVKDPAYQSSKVIIAWDPFRHRGVIAMQNLPAPATGNNYQLWVLDPGALSPISAGLIHPDAGSSSFAVQPPSTTSPGFAITLEPGQGSPEPTGSILFAIAPGQ